jgi:enamine deaminase RidA (YjgF/YER057c/UK114 family)
MNPHPYSPAYLAGGFGFVSGALSVDEDGRAVSGRLEAVEAATARLSERLQTVGLDLADVVKTTYFVTDVSLREEANRHYEQTYSPPRPARSFVEVAALPYGATVEIEAVAHQDPARSILSGS